MYAWLRRSHTCCTAVDTLSLTALKQTFDSKRDRGVLEDVGLMKQLGRLDEEQALDAIKNYRDAASRRGGKSILNPSAYFMVILREFIEVRRFTHALMLSHATTCCLKLKCFVLLVSFSESTCGCWTQLQLRVAPLYLAFKLLSLVCYTCLHHCIIAPCIYIHTTGHYATAELSRQRRSFPYLHVSTRLSQWQQPRYEQQQ
jgi:hypothetical protein